MNPKRLEMLRKFVEEDPSDPFNWYALALELSTAQEAEAGRRWDELIQNHPDYLPAYYQAGLHWIKHNDQPKASSILNNGIALAQKQGNFKTLAELRSLLEDLE